MKSPIPAATAAYSSVGMASTINWRTPPWVIPRWDHKITKVEHLLLRIPGTPALVRAVLYWMLESRVWGFRHPWLMRIADRVARGVLP